MMQRRAGRALATIRYSAGMIEYVTFEDVMRWRYVGAQGTTIEGDLERLTGNGETLSELYTVYWPKDSIRVIPGSSYAVARTVLAILRDPRTRHMGHPTVNQSAELSIVRRELASPNEWAGLDQVNSSTVYVKDRLLPADISVSMAPQDLEMADPNVTLRLDLSTLPEF